MPSDYTFISTAMQLKEALGAFQNTDVMALDLEADSMYHFKEKVCLLQLATPEQNFILDPKAVPDISALKPLLANQCITKVLHGADYDIRSLYRDFGFEIHNLFDTEIASRFIGMKSTGLNAVVQHYFDVKLDKRFQKKDWSRRPLSAEMIAYAARDTQFLIPLFQILQKKLSQLSRLEWVTEECRILSRVRPAPPSHQPLFFSFKGANRLAPRELAVLEALLQFREEVARRKDRPVFKIMNSQSLLLLTKLGRPLTPKTLETTNILSRKQNDMYAAELIKRVDKALIIPENELPVFTPRKDNHIETPVPRRLKALKKWRQQASLKLGIDPGFIVNNRLLTAITILNPKNIDALDAIKEMRPWQRAEFGRQIVDALHAK